MKRYIAFMEGGSWGVREDPKGGWVSFDDAEAEIEKARGEGRDEAFSSRNIKTVVLGPFGTVKCAILEDGTAVYPRETTEWTSRNPFDE